MAAWILIILINNSGSAHVHHVEFGSERACIEARDKVLAVKKGYGPPDAICTAKE